MQTEEIMIHVCQLCARDICEPGQPYCRGCESDLTIVRMRQHAEHVHTYQRPNRTLGLICFAISFFIVAGTIVAILLGVSK